MTQEEYKSNKFMYKEYFLHKFENKCFVTKNGQYVKIKSFADENLSAQTYETFLDRMEKHSIVDNKENYIIIGWCKFFEISEFNTISEQLTLITKKSFSDYESYEQISQEEFDDKLYNCSNYYEFVNEQDIIFDSFKI